MKLLKGEDSRILLVLALDQEWAMMDTLVSLAASLPRTRAILLEKMITLRTTLVTLKIASQYHCHHDDRHKCRRYELIS
jgi:hypothetical protein